MEQSETKKIPGRSLIDDADSLVFLHLRYGYYRILCISFNIRESWIDRDDQWWWFWLFWLLLFFLRFVWLIIIAKRVFSLSCWASIWFTVWVRVSMCVCVNMDFGYSLSSSLLCFLSLSHAYFTMAFGVFCSFSLFVCDAFVLVLLFESNNNFCYFN